MVTPEQAIAVLWIFCKAWLLFTIFLIRRELEIHEARIFNWH